MRVLNDWQSMKCLIEFSLSIVGPSWSSFQTTSLFTPFSVVGSQAQYQQQHSMPSVSQQSSGLVSYGQLPSNTATGSSGPVPVQQGPGPGPGPQQGASLPPQQSPAQQAVHYLDGASHAATYHHPHHQQAHGAHVQQLFDPMGGAARSLTQMSSPVQSQVPQQQV